MIQISLRLSSFYYLHSMLLCSKYIPQVVTLNVMEQQRIAIKCKIQFNITTLMYINMGSRNELCITILSYMHLQWRQTSCCRCSTCTTTFSAPPRIYIYKGAILASAASAVALPVFQPRSLEHSKELPRIPQISSLEASKSHFALVVFSLDWRH